MRRLLPFLVSLSLLAAVGCRKGGPDSATDGSPATPEGPSVLLITLDTLRADRLGCYGHPADATPHLDRLAAEGVLFRRAFCHTPLTIPSHVTIMTGQYPV